MGGAINTIGGVVSSLVNPVGAIVSGIEGKNPLTNPGAALTYGIGGSPAPKGGAFGNLTFNSPSVPGSLTTPTSTPAPSIPVTSSASGAATPVKQMSPGEKGAISAGAIGQLPGLIKSDTGSGMTGISPSFLANQASWASGFTDQGNYIQQLVNEYLKNNPNSNVNMSGMGGLS